MDMAAYTRYLERVEKLELREKVKFLTEWKDEALERERIVRDDLENAQTQAKAMHEVLKDILVEATSEFIDTWIIPGDAEDQYTNPDLCSECEFTPDWSPHTCFIGKIQALLKEINDG